MKPHYNPHTLNLDPGKTVYSFEHEAAHATQHCRRTLAWRGRETLLSTPILNRVANLFVETEAALMALATLAGCHVLSGRDLREAARGIGSYLASLPSPRLLWLFRQFWA